MKDEDDLAVIFYSTLSPRPEHPTLAGATAASLPPPPPLRLVGKVAHQKLKMRGMVLRTEGGGGARHAAD